MIYEFDDSYQKDLIIEMIQITNFMDANSSTSNAESVHGLEHCGVGRHVWVVRLRTM